MKLLNKQNALRAAKIMGLAVLLLSIIVYGYVYVVLNELKLKIEETKVVKSEVTSSKSILESDTRVIKKDLEDFVIFTSQGESKSSWHQCMRQVI